VTDSCPSCKRPDVRPRQVITDASGTTASYRCPCGKTWNRDVEGEAS
jgi:transposase-like protein